MPLTSPRAMFERAYKEGYAIGAFNVNNMEIIQGIMEAGTEEKAPLILQVSAGARKYAGQNYIVKLIEAGLLEADLPVVLHLDHGADFDICKACVDGGFTSVMIDGSHHSFEDNIAVIDTDIRLAMTASIRKQLVEHPEEFDPRGYLKPARQAVKDMVQHKIKHVLGCSGKA